MTPKTLPSSVSECKEPICPHFGLCGGCALQNISYDNQLLNKASKVKGLIRGVYSDFEFETASGIIPSPEVFYYRNKMEFTFGDEVKGGPLALGLHKKGRAYDILSTDGCLLIHPDMDLIRAKTCDFFGELYDAGKIDFYHKRTHEGYLRHLLVRRAASTGEILVGLVTTSQWNTEVIPASPDKGRCLRQQMNEPASPDKGRCLRQQTEGFAGKAGGGVSPVEAFVNMLLNLDLKGRVVGILHIINDSFSDIVKSDRTDILYGRDYITENICGLEFKVSAFSFFQTNTFGAEKLYEKAAEYASSSEKAAVIYDLYSGTGTISLLMSKAAREVIGVEIVKEAVDAAKENAELNGIGNVRFIAEDVLKVLKDGASYGLSSPDLIILDPPRDGINPKALGKILGFGVKRIVYISCKPESLARDLQAFEIAGYGIDKGICVDMFPQTSHVETVCKLVLRKPTVHINIDVDVEELVQDKRGTATYEQIKAYVLEQFGLKVSSLYISQIKRKCGLDVGQNYNLPKKEDARVPQCPSEKENAIIEALKYYKML